MDLGTVKGSLEFDTTKAEAALKNIADAAGKLEASPAQVEVGADTTKAEANLAAVHSFLSGVLNGMRAEVEVSGDTGKAETAIKAVEGMLNGLEGEMSTLEVDADTSRAEQALDSMADAAADAGSSGGDRAGDGMVAGILAGLASIPIAGAIVKIGQAVGGALTSAIQDGLGQEVTRDLFSARTGLDAATADKFARAAGAAYADAFGQSIEGNLDIAREALSAGLIDPDATSEAVQSIIGQLDTLSTIAEEEASAISLALSRMVDSGLAGSVEEAMDVLTRGFQSGANVAADLLDSFTEYSSSMSALGLDAAAAVGLMNQGLDAGIRNTDVIADALNEFGIRMREGTEEAAEALEGIGLNAGEMFDAVAAGGPAAAGALDAVFDALRNIEDPVARNAAGVALFGTMWEDTAGKLASLDVSSAVGGLGEIEGALQSAMDTLADNPATALESARRNIEVALDGIKGALATAFSDPLQSLAEWASGNQAGVMQFLGGLANGFFDMAEAGVNSVATIIQAAGALPGAFSPAVESLASIATQYQMLSVLIPGMPGLPDSVIANIASLQAGIDGAADSAATAADALRTNLIDNGIAPVRDAFNEELEVAINAAEVNDAVSDLVGRVDDLGASLGSIEGVELDLGGTFSTATSEGALLDEQMRGVVASMEAMQGAAAAAGEGQASLTERFNIGREAVLGQLEALGMSREAAASVAEAYGLIPAMIETSVYLETAPAYAQIGDLSIAVDSASGTITVNGDVTPANTTLGQLLGNVDAATGTVTIAGNQVPANMTLEQLLGLIGGSTGTVTIDGNDYSGREVLGNFAAAVRSSSASMALGLDTSSAAAQMRYFLSTIPSTVTIRAVAVGSAAGLGIGFGNKDGGAIARAAGGPVVGPGGARDDLVPAINTDTGTPYRLSNGEHILTADDVVDLGGQQGAYMLRAMIQAGQVKPLQGEGFADGGGVGAAGGGMSATPRIYVQNPWTGEYHEARMASVAQRETKRLIDNAARGGSL